LVKKSTDFENSDIIPGLYEGGYKVWECCIDLSEYLAQSHDCLAGKRVIELGCGQGIPGVTALHLGAEEVHFQDYDPEVIRDLTIPVVRENLSMIPMQSNPEDKARYFSGDWGSLPAKLEEIGRIHGYDFVLTAETIYRLDSMARILHCIKKVIGLQ
jgi:predicted nicotinamide N-methyase